MLLETALGERYGVSRTPLREVIIERSARGFRVRTTEEILAIYEARISLESTAADLPRDRVRLRR